MKLTEAILKVLSENEDSALTYTQINDAIKDHEDIDIENPRRNSVSTQLRNWIKSGDSRVSTTGEKKGQKYYLTKNQKQVLAKRDLDTKNKNAQTETETETETEYRERDLHPILGSYLYGIANIHSVTIFHEQSNKKDKQQKWIHPDMVGIKFNDLHNDDARNFRNILDKKEEMDLHSYEIKRTIKTDAELKDAYFQAISNSSWSNYGYLVALYIDKSLIMEIKRLNQLFGIGVIELKPAVFTSKIIIEAKHKNIDFETIDKLCNTNEKFNTFICKTHNVIENSRSRDLHMDELIRFCNNNNNELDKIFEKDEDIMQYCKDKNINPQE